MYAINEIESQELNTWLGENKDFVLVDVRTPGEMMQGVISSGTPMPLNMLPSQLNSLPKDKPVVLYCRTGARSAQGAAFMMSRGFENAYNLRGGIMDWARQGLQIVAPDPEMFGAVNNPMSMSR